MRNKFILPNAFLFIYTAVLCYIYHINGGIFLKAATSLGFLLIALLNGAFTFFYNKSDRKFAILVLLGVFSSFLGDIILNIDFIIGALIFAVGHIFYFSSYCSISDYKIKDLFIAVLIFIPSFLFILLCPIFNFGSGLMKLVCIIYAGIISSMLGKAISSLLQSKEKFFYIVAAGSLLFFISDIALLFYVFGNAGEAANTVCLLTYFPAQCILAYSVYEKSNSK